MQNFNDELTEIKVRKWIRQILHERYTSPSSVSADAFDKIMVEPFARIFKRTKLGLKQVLTSTKFAFDMLTTIDPIKKHTMGRNYKARKQEMEGKRKEIMQGLYEPLERFGPSLEVAAFLFNPVGYVTAALPRSVIKNRGSIVDFFREAGFGDPSKAEVTDTKDKDIKIKEPKGIIGVTFDALKKLFFLEATIIDDELLIEQETPTGGEFKSDIVIRDQLSDGGILNKTATAAKQELDATKKLIDDWVDLYKPGVEAVDEIAEASMGGDVDRFLNSLKKAERAGVKIQDVGPSEIMKKFNEDVDKVLADPEELAKITKKATVKDDSSLVPDDQAPTIDPELIRKDVEIAILGSASSTIRQNMVDSRKKMVTDAVAMLGEIEPSSEGRETIGRTELGRQYLALFDNAKDILRIS